MSRICCTKVCAVCHGELRSDGCATTEKMRHLPQRQPNAFAHSERACVSSRWCMDAVRAHLRCGCATICLKCSSSVLRPMPMEPSISTSLPCSPRTAPAGAWPWACCCCCGRSAAALAYIAVASTTRALAPGAAADDARVPKREGTGATETARRCAEAKSSLGRRAAASAACVGVAAGVTAGEGPAEGAELRVPAVAGGWGVCSMAATASRWAVGGNGIMFSNICTPTGDDRARRVHEWRTVGTVRQPVHVVARGQASTKTNALER